MTVNGCAGKPVIDETALQTLRAALGESLPALVADCLADVEACCARMNSAAQSLDGLGVKRAAHSLAGVLGQFACPRAACMARAAAEAPEADALAAAAALLEVARAAAAELARLAGRH